MRILRQLSASLIICLGLMSILLITPAAGAGVSARYVRVENPTGFMMEWQEIEVISGGQNVVFKHPEMFSGTVVPGHNPRTSEGVAMTDGRKDTHLRGPGFVAAINPEDNSPGINPWFEIDLGKPVEIDKVVLYASRYDPHHMYLDKGHRIVSLLDDSRRVTWAKTWDYYDNSHYPEGVFAFDTAPAPSPAVGVQVPVGTGNWAPMGWVMGAADIKAAPDTQQRLSRFAARNSPAEVEKLAQKVFSLLADDVPELAEARKLYSAGRYSQALDAWKKYWFAKMRRANMHVAFHGGFYTYATQGDDLVAGLAVTIGDTSATAIRFTPGAILWIDLPDPGKKQALAEALTDTEQKAQVGRVTRPLLDAWRRHPDPKYLQRWSEMMDDWSINFFHDAAATPYEAENLFTFNPCNMWGTLMEDLSDMAVERPELIDQVPAATFARVQLICLEKYSTAWWRQARETVFNHETGGITAWADVCPYIDEFNPGRRAAREVRQEFERWMTLGTEPDGSMTEIGDDGHVVMPMFLSSLFSRWDQSKPDWYTPGWRNRAMEWHDNNFKYILRHMSPGGYEHRFAVGYRPERWLSEVAPYVEGRPKNLVPLDRGNVFYAIPEVRRILDALGHITSGLPAPTKDPLRKPVLEQQQKAHDQVQALLGSEKPGAPHINSDWMPYTGAYYFRGGWGENDPFLAMMACGSHGGSQPTQWPYGMYYYYDYNYPLIRAQPLQVDGLPPNQLFGRRTFEPGTKTIALCNAEEKPAQHRWISTEHFDFGEAIYHGAYQRLPSFKGDWDYTLEQLPAGKAVEGVNTTRQIIQVRGSRLFIVTDAVEFPSPGAHQVSIPFKLCLSSLQNGASKPFNADQLQIDAKTSILRSDNPDGPSVSLYQFAGVPITYHKGSEAKLDFKSYSPRLTGGVGIAEQDVSAEFQVGTGGAASALVSLISSRPHGGEERVASVEPMTRGAKIAGFHATLRAGGDIWYQFAASGHEKLSCGPAEANAVALLVVTGAAPGETSGILLGGTSLSISGKPIELAHPDLEFVIDAAGVKSRSIDTPVDPVSFLPNRNAFVGSQVVDLASKTPHVQIRYTTDGTPPTRASKLYAGPITITQSTEFAARAYRLGPDGKPLDADEFEVNGTRFSAPTYGWFYKQDFRPALQVPDKDLVPGLEYDYLVAPWWELYAAAHWLPADACGVADREMDLSKVYTHDANGMRNHGYIKVPQDGLYTFDAPHELSYMDNAPSYDLRLYIDGEEWYLTQWWHGHGTWSIPLKAGLHAFQVDFADARSTPWRKSGLWRYYPRSWVIYQGNPTDILITGPGLDHARIPKEWFLRKPL